MIFGLAVLPNNQAIARNLLYYTSLFLISSHLFPEVTVMKKFVFIKLFQT